MEVARARRVSNHYKCPLWCILYHANGSSAIESRVARIKARVAELTGNMEGVQGPNGARPAVPR